MSVVYRVGNHKDISAIAHFLNMSDQALSKYLLDGLLADRNIEEFIELAVADESTNLFYKNTIVVDADKEIKGAINFYPAIKHEISDIMYSFLSDEKIEVITPLFNGLPEDSLYIHSLACDQNYTKSNIYFGLMIQCFKAARDQGFQTVSAHVWPSNTKYLAFLQKMGAQVIKRIPMKPLAIFDYQEEVCMLSCDVRKAN